MHVMGPPPRSLACGVVSLSFLQPGRGGAKDEARERGLRGYTYLRCFLPVRPTVSTPGGRCSSHGLSDVGPKAPAEDLRPQGLGQQRLLSPPRLPWPSLVWFGSSLTRSHLRGF